MDENKAAGLQVVTTGIVARVSVTERPAAARFNLRIDPAHLTRASKVVDLEIPDVIGSRTANGARSALCLGPDEWVLHAPENERDEIERAFLALYAEIPHSLVDISDREIGIEISGSGAEMVLAAGCPLDLRELPIGGGTRSVFDTAQIVLIREEADRFLIEVWRSFAPHVRAILYRARDELLLGL